MYTIGITGGTASGKSTFVELLKQKCHGLPINFISQDDYYNDTSSLNKEQLKAINFDHPDSLDFDLLSKHLTLLGQGLEINKPLYSFEKHNRIKKTELVNPLPILVIEGILILSDPKIKSLCNTSIFIDAPEAIRIQRRIKRDIEQRGRTKDSVLFQFEKNIIPMHRQFIEPVKNSVDFIFDGTKSFSAPVKKVHQLILEILS